MAQRVAAPRITDRDSLKRIFRYIAKTLDVGILYRNGETTIPSVYSDADWANCLETRKSIGAFTSHIAGGAISWQSKQQTLVATSTTEAELLAASSATKEAIWLRKLARDIGLGLSGPTTIFEDNNATAAIANNPTHHGRTKHYDVLHHFVRQRVSLGDVTLVRCASRAMVADSLTKGTGRVLFEEHKIGMGLVTVDEKSGGV